MHISNMLLACSVGIQKIGEDINLFVNDRKHGIIHPQLLTPKQLIAELNKLEEEHNIKYSIRLKEYNYQHIIDISDLSVTIIDRKLVYSLQIPILEKESFRTYHLIPIP